MWDKAEGVKYKHLGLWAVGKMMVLSRVTKRGGGLESKDREFSFAHVVFKLQ